MQKPSLIIYLYNYNKILKLKIFCRNYSLRISFLQLIYAMEQISFFF